MEESWRRKWQVVRKWNVIVWKGVLSLFSVSWHHLTLLQTHWASVSLKSCPVWFVFVYVLTACVFVTRDTVRHPRCFVFGKFVRKPNCSWTEVWLYWHEQAAFLQRVPSASHHLFKNYMQKWAGCSVWVILYLYFMHKENLLPCNSVSLSHNLTDFLSHDCRFQPRPHPPIMSVRYSTDILLP